MIEWLFKLDRRLAGPDARRSHAQGTWETATNKGPSQPWMCIH